MQRYYFHFLWPDDAVRDTEGVELEGFAAAYRYAWGLVQQVHSRFPGVLPMWTGGSRLTTAATSQSLFSRHGSGQKNCQASAGDVLVTDPAQGAMSARDMLGDLVCFARGPTAHT